METREENQPQTPVARRALAKGAVWATPAIVMTAAAPRASASLDTSPGLQGWWNWGNKSCSFFGNRLSFTVSSNSGRTPNLALCVSAIPQGCSDQLGIWVFDADRKTPPSNAQLTFYLPTSFGDATFSGNFGSWSKPTKGSAPNAPTVEGYTAYKTAYSGAWQYVPANGSVPGYWYALNDIASFNVQSRYNTGLCSTQGLQIEAYRYVEYNGKSYGVRHSPIKI